ncbi:MAG: transglycosylase SLT domain-containing protein [Nitrospirae bacterium]|nr:transglycosylase SLT domain-containing protein [Nitrospirota bacterium]
MRSVKEQACLQRRFGIFFAILATLTAGAGISEGGMPANDEPAGIALQVDPHASGTPSPATADDTSSPTVQTQQSPAGEPGDEQVADAQAPSPEGASFSPELLWEPETILLPQLKAQGLAWRFSGLFAPQDDLPVAPGFTGEPAEESIDNVPLVVDHKVERHLKFFHTAIRDRFEQWLARFARYKPLADRIFSEFELPSDLVFLSLVESGFNPHAYSRARATGPWQFMKSTAKLYGLRVDQYVDERRDPIKSTVAAARYLRDLYDLFGAWPLAMAAYNAGEGKVLRALQKARADSFWDIAQTRHLRRETRDYVPRFMAAAMIAKNPDLYGFSQEHPVLHEFEEVVVRRSVHLRAVANATGISFYELRQLNPELRRDVTPPDDAEYHLKIPVGTKAVVGEMLDRIITWKRPALSAKRGTSHREAEGAGWYKVQVGDSLWTIAKRFRLSVQDLKERNNLAGRRIKPGDLLAIGP